MTTLHSFNSIPLNSLQAASFSGSSGTLHGSAPQKPVFNTGIQFGSTEANGQTLLEAPPVLSLPVKLITLPFRAVGYVVRKLFGLDAAIAQISLDGVITDRMAKQLEKQIYNLPKEIKGIFLEIDSPGGSADATQRMMEVLKSLKDKKIPITVYVKNMACSGGMWLASIAGKENLFAPDFATLGSIGVVQAIPFLDISKKLKEFGISVERFATSDEKKGPSILPLLDVPVLVEPLTEKLRKKISEEFSKTFETFKRVIQQNLKLSDEQIKRFSTGETFKAAEVKGELCTVGNRQDAKDNIEKRAGVGWLGKPNYVEIAGNPILDMFGLQQLMALANQWPEGLQSLFGKFLSPST